MLDENEFIQLFSAEMVTDLEERDPTKPLIHTGVGDLVKPNPYYDPEAALKQKIERRRKHLGTSFFVNFDPLCHLHQLDLQQLGETRGEIIRKDIKRQLKERFLSVFVAQCPSENPPPMAALRKILRVEICPYSQIGFNNGEAYMWLPNQPLVEDFVFQILRGLYGSLNDDPIFVDIDGTNYPVIFYGWGFRYI